MNVAPTRLPVEQNHTRDQLKALLAKQRAYFETRATLPLAWRREQVEKLERAVKANEQLFLDALKHDLGKNAGEGYLGELGFLYQELRHTKNSLKRWMKPRKVSAPLVIQPAKAFQVSEPLGVALIISPWNYPVQLALPPVLGALAAGCTVVLKPSELSSATSRALAKVLGETFPEEICAVVEGDHTVGAALLELRWDTIFFTGSTQVGRIVAQAAAKHLTPVTLELGGKSPCIVNDELNLQVAARRITWGKFFNAGQTCIAPDYVLVPKKLKEPFIAEVKRAVNDFYGADPKQSRDYCRIINDRHFARLERLKQDGKIVVGGESDASERYLAPTVITEVSPDSPLMQEEIFGPLLPVLECETTEEAIRFVRARPKPLALYSFSSNQAVNDTIVRETSSGGAVVNDTVVHFASDSFPFGGVGESGMGRYHGKDSFDAFSHLKSVVKKGFFGDVAMRYPPYTDQKLSLFRRFMK